MTRPKKGRPHNPELDDTVDGEPNVLVCGRCGKPQGKGDWDALARAHRSCPVRVGGAFVTGRTERVLLCLTPVALERLDRLRGPLTRAACVDALLLAADRPLPGDVSMLSRLIEHHAKRGKR